MLHEQFLSEVDKTYAEQQSTIARDLKINFKRLIEDSTISGLDGILATLAITRSLDLREINSAARKALVGDGVDPAQIQEAEETAAIMGMLNTYYRFRHFVDPQQNGEPYGPAKLRMQSLSQPQLGKERFEMLAFAVSIINGCEKCVTSHEKALLEMSVDKEKLHDLARLAATLKGLQALLT